MKRSLNALYFMTFIAVFAIISVVLSSEVNALELTENKTLDANVTDGIHVPVGATVTLDLNGFEVTGVVTTTASSASNSATIVNEGTLVIKDTAGTGKVIGGETGAYAVLNRDGNLTIDGGNFSIVDSAYTCVSTAGKTPNIRCTTFGGPSLIANGWYNGSQNTNATYSTLTINGGTFTGGINNVKNDEWGKLTINDGTFISKNYNELTFPGISTDTTLKSVSVLTGGKSTKIVDGTFGGSIRLQIEGQDQDKTFEVSGGTFDTDGTYGTSISLDGTVAATNQNYYSSLIIKNVEVKSIDLVKLPITDVTVENVNITNANSSSALVIDTISGTGTIKNVQGPKVGTIKTTANGHLTIENLTTKAIDSSRLDKDYYTIGGNVNVKDSSFTHLKATTVVGKFDNVDVSYKLVVSGKDTELTLSDGEYNKITASEYKSLIIENADVTEPITYSVTKKSVAKIDNVAPGTFTVSKTYANAGDEITLTNSPKAGFTFGKYVVTKKNDADTIVTVTDGKFVMPEYPVDVYAVFGFDISDFDVTGIVDKTYTGNSLTQNITVSKDNVTLTTDDYKVTYGDNVNAGTAKVTIEGTGNYVGTIEKTFKINPVKITASSVTGIVNKTYNKKAQTQKVVVKVNGKTLKNGTDYTVSYKNNKNIGKATVVVKGKGNYVGTINKYFNIYPTKIAIKKFKVSHNSIRVYYYAPAGGVKYQVAYKQSGNKTYKYVKTKKTNLVAKYLKYNRKYYFKVRTYKVVNGKTYYGPWSKVKTKTTQRW